MQAIPLVDVRAEYEPLIPRLEAAFREVLESERFIRGPHYWAFQEEAAAYLGGVFFLPLLIAIKPDSDAKTSLDQLQFQRDRIDRLIKARNCPAAS